MRCLLLTMIPLAAAGSEGIAGTGVRQHAGRVLFVVSAASTMKLADGSGMDVGYWAIELAQPYRTLREAGYEIVIASPGGKTPTPDPYSASDRGLGGPERAAEIRSFLADLPDLQHPQTLEDLKAADMDAFDAIFIPGGYAPMVDLAASPALGALLRRAMEANKIVASICHGPTAFLAARRDGEPWVFDGYEMAVFSNEEEAAWLKERRLSWRAEDALKKAGARPSCAATWSSHVVVDRNVITGQSAPSCREFSATLLRELRARKGAR